MRSINSYLGFLIHYQSYGIRRKAFSELHYFWKACYIQGKFQVVKNIIYEKDTASVIRTKKEAQDYALIQIYQDYEANRTSKKEKIDSIQLINFIEYEDRYYFKFIVSACKNIVEFKPF